METNEQTPPAPKVSRAAALVNRVQADMQPKPPVEAPPVVQSVKPKQEAVAVPTDRPNEYEINPKPRQEVQAKTPPASQEILDDPSGEIEQIAGKESENDSSVIKKMRSALKNATQQVKSHNTELETLRKKVTDYENGLAVPEVTAAQLARIEELEKYEKLYNLKATPAYREKYVKPIEEEKSKLQSLAKDYGVSEEVLNAAFNAPTAAETNRILSQSFQDDVGALEAKSLLRNIKKIQTEAHEAEKEPVQTFSRLQEESDRIMQEKRQRANEAIVYTSKDAWSEALLGLREDNRFPELVYREGDTEHNEKYVRPTLTKAGQEFGKIVKTLAQNGLTEMPKDLGIAMSRMCQLAHQAGILAHHREQLANRVAELENLLGIKNGLDRPGVNSTGGGMVTSNQTSRGVGVKTAARNVLSRVMGK